MKQNVIILTSGLSGSSVLTSLIARASYWAGDNTQKKEYDTYENAELVRLNLQLFEAAGFSPEFQTRGFSPEALDKICSLRASLDLAPFREFLNRCNDHRPWIWKDPRLWLTIRFWNNLLDLKDCRFVLLTRNQTQCWISTTLRRQIVTYKSFLIYEKLIQESILEFFDESRAPHLYMRYEDLLLHPVETIGQLNEFLGTALTVGDLTAVYHKPLYKIPRSRLDLLKAISIYLKNYSERIELVSSPRKRWSGRVYRTDAHGDSVAP